jgi:hypothetical protein
VDWFILVKYIFITTCWDPGVLKTKALEPFRFDQIPNFGLGRILVGIATHPIHDVMKKIHPSFLLLWVLPGNQPLCRVNDWIKQTHNETFQDGW